MPMAKRLIRLRAELLHDLARLDELEHKNRIAAERIDAGARDELDYAALGFTIHNIYCLVENYALRVAKTFENDIRGEAWHRELLERMTLDIPTVRPPLWDRALASGLDELRRFRHAFRNMYANDIDPERVALLNKRLPGLLERLRHSHERFVRKLDYMIQSLGE
jgi:hypothetical protein